LFKIGEDPNIDDLGFACCTLLVKMKRWKKFEVVEMRMKILTKIACNLNWIQIHLNSIQSLFIFLSSNANQIYYIQLKRYRMQLDAQGIKNMLIISIKNWHWIRFSKIHFHSIPFKTKSRFKIYLDRTRLLVNLKTCLPYANFDVIIVAWIKWVKEVEIGEIHFYTTFECFWFKHVFCPKNHEFLFDKEHGCIILQHEVALIKFCQIIILFWKIYSNTHFHFPS
jgi:hypothetical protein